MQLDELLRCCQQELAAGFALRQACLQQQRAMVGGGAEAVRNGTAATASALDAWRQAAEARHAATVALGAADLASLLGSLPREQAERVTEHRDALLASWGEIERLNRQNDVLVRHSLAVIDLSLQRLVGGRSPTYGPRGRRALAARVLSKGG